MATTNNKLPANLQPAGDDICLPLFVPNDQEWIWEVVKALGIPALKRYWVDDDSGENDILRKEWEARIVNPFIDKVLNAIPCGGESGIQCFDLLPQSSAFEYHPNDPHVDPSNIEGAPVATFMRWGLWGELQNSNIPQITEWVNSFAQNITGYFPTDVMLAPEVQNLFQNPIAQLADLFGYFTQFPFPYIKITVNGAVEVEIDLLKVPFGGTCYIIPDYNLSFSALWDTIVEIVDNDGEPPNFWGQAELNRDIFSLPPELDTVVKKEIVFDTDEEHTIHVVFVPQINDEIPFYFPFGGIRGIEICGGTAVDPNTGDELDPINYGDEIFIREGVVSVTTVNDICAGVICALEQSASRFLSGQAGNIVGGISIGTDGTVTIETQSGETGSIDYMESHNGGCQAVANGIYALFADIENWKDTYTNEQVTQTFVASKYDVDQTTMDAKISAIYTPYSTDQWYDGTGDTLPEKLFCEGATKETISAWIIDQSFAETVFFDMLGVVSAVNVSQINQWYANGASIPLNDYLSFACRLRQDLELSVTGAQMAARTNRTVATTNWTFDHPRAIRVTVTGKYIDTVVTGEEQDTFYYISGTGVTPVVRNDWDYFRSGGSAPIHNLLPTNTPEYNANGDYAWTVVLPANAVQTYIQMLWDESNLITNPEGTIEAVFKDLGAV